MQDRYNTLARTHGVGFVTVYGIYWRVKHTETYGTTREV